MICTQVFIELSVKVLRRIGCRDFLDVIVLYNRIEFHTIVCGILISVSLLLVDRFLL